MDVENPHCGLTARRSRAKWRPASSIRFTSSCDDSSCARFVVTSLSPDAVDARTLYEDRYCARGDMENRIKEQQLFLFADRTSAQTMRANQMRLWLSSVAYVLFVAVREFGLKGTELENAQCNTIRTKLLKIGARVRVTFRRVWLSFSESYPWQRLFQQVLLNLQRLRPMRLQI